MPLRDGIPVAVALHLDGAQVVVLCPLCWEQHRHGWNVDEDTGYSHRSEHCTVRTPDARGYWIPPTAGVPR